MKIQGRVAVLLALACAASLARAGEIQVRLTEKIRKEYSVEGLFRVPASTDTVLEVLTDYEHIGRFVPSLRTSRVVGSLPGGGSIVEQEAVGGVLFLTKAIHVRLDVRRQDGGLSFEDRLGRDFRSYFGSWSFRPVVGGTEVAYRLTAEPAFAAPGLILRRGLKRGARDLLDEVRGEIVRRAEYARRPEAP